MMSAQTRVEEKKRKKAPSARTACREMKGRRRSFIYKHNLLLLIRGGSQLADESITLHSSHVVDFSAEKTKFSREFSVIDINAG